MIKLEIDGQTFDVEEGFSRLSESFRKAIPKAAPQIARSLDEYLHMIGEKLAARHGQGYPSQSATSLARRTGALVTALTDGIKITSGTSLSDISGEFILPDYAGIQETGGAINAKGGGYLAIPLPAALKGDGTPIKDSPRDWDNTFCATSKRGNLIIFRKIGRGRIVPLYVLKRRVDIPARLGLQDAVETDMGYFADKAVTAILNAILDIR